MNGCKLILRFLIVVVSLTPTFVFGHLDCMRSLNSSLTLEKLELIKRISLVFSEDVDTPYLSAASGVVRQGDSVYVIADNDLKLGLINLKTGQRELLKILEGSLPKEEKARKKAKPDFESLFRIDDIKLGLSGLVAFPSGSSENRFVGVFIPINKEGSADPVNIRTFRLDSIFNPIIEKYGHLNIEGSFVDEQSFGIFHRGNTDGDTNRIFEYSRDLIVKLIKGDVVDRPVLANRVVEFSVGELEKVRLTITDATVFEGQKFFLAAAEDTSNPIDDGEVKGTVLGRFKENGEIEILATVYGQKAEGLSLQRKDQGIEVTLVTDNDNPEVASEVLIFRLVD